MNVLCAMLACAVLAAPQEVSFLKQAYGPATIAAATGNGGLTVSLDAQGSVRGMHWPSPGYYDHVDNGPWIARKPDADAELPQRAGWEVQIGGDQLDLSDPAWKTSHSYRGPASGIVETRFEHTESGMQVTQTVFVHPERDILVSQLDIEADLPPDAVTWQGLFTPSAQLLEGFPGVLNAAYEVPYGFTPRSPDDARAYIMRPAAMSSGTTARARDLLTDAAPLEGWDRIESAVWIGLQGFPQATASSALVVDGERQAIPADGPSPKDPVAGAVHVTLQGQPADDNGMHSAWIAIAFAKDRAGVSELLAFAAERGYEGLLEDTESHWQARLNGEPIKSRYASAVRPMAQSALRILEVCRDRESGAVVRAPVNQPPLALAWPKHNALTAIALASAGRVDEARDMLSFIAGAIRTAPEPSAPEGSVPYALYADGSEASPRFMLDLESAAAFLWACRRHGESLDQSARAAFHDEVFEAVDGAADFLCDWWNAQNGMPLPSYDPAKLRNTMRPEQLLTMYRGLHHALAIAEARGVQRERWVEQRAALVALIRRHIAQGMPEWHMRFSPGDWLAVPGYMEGLTDLFPLEEERLREAVAERLKQLPEQRATEAARAAHHTALIITHREQPMSPAERDRLMRAIGGALRETAWTDAPPGSDAPWPDSLTATYVLLTLDLLGE